MTRPAAEPQPGAKERLRAEALARRRALDATARARASQAIQDALLAWLAERELETAPLLIYRAMNSEVDTRRILDRPHPALYAPAVREHAMTWLRVDAGTSWRAGGMGVMEPANGKPWTTEMPPGVLVCPLAGFDRAGNRLGLGKGCFDRWLAEHRARLRAVVGLAFACQELPAIPAEPHDEPLDVIITEREIIECRTR